MSDFSTKMKNKVEKWPRKAKKFFKSWWNWLLLAEKEHEGKFEEKYKKPLIVGRIITIFLTWLFFDQLFDIAPLLDPFDSPRNAFCLFIYLIIGYILVVVYKGCIQKIWDFLKKDAIVHYIFMAIIPAIIIFYSYQYIHKGKTGFPPKAFKSNEAQSVQKEYDEIIDRLNGFYSSLLASIAVIGGVLALGTWRGYKKMEEKLEKFSEIEADVNFLKEKSELAKWVQNIFDKDDKKTILSSTELPIQTIEDKNRYEDIAKHILNEATDDSWLKIVYAKKLMEKASIVNETLKRITIKEKDERKEINLDIERIYERVIKIFEFIETRDLFKDDSDVETTLHNLHGKVYWEKYKTKKSEFIFETKPYNEWWNKEKDQFKLLENSEEYYQNALELSNQRRIDADETLGNLALVLIEKTKFSPNSNISTSNLDKAIKFLKKKSKKDYNNYWDHARALYYKDRRDKEIDTLLDRTVSEIYFIDDKNFFIERMETELKEKVGGAPGFPGDMNRIENLKEKLDKKKLS